jgi:hypothetical protein
MMYRIQTRDDEKSRLPSVSDIPPKVSQRGNSEPAKKGIIKKKK